MRVFPFGGMTLHSVPTIDKWGVQDLGDDPAKHRWRAQWFPGDASGEVGGISLQAYPVIRLTPAGAWIDTCAYRQATKQPWEEGAPALEWVTSKTRSCHRWVGNESGQAWAKPTMELAIQSIAVRLERWTARIASDRIRAMSAVVALKQLRPDLEFRALRAEGNLKSVML